MRRLVLSTRLFLVWLAVAWLVGCVANPVTGKKELRLVSESEEIRLGKAHYLTSQQMQGGLYNADPDLARYVQETGEKLARVSDCDLPYEFVLLNNSTPNAWALPGGKSAVNRGLLTALNGEAELAAVLGHDIVHAAARHGAKSVERGILLQGVISATGLVARDSDYASLIAGGAQLAAGLITQRYGRDAERESDYYGMQYMARAGYDPQAAVSLQEAMQLEPREAQFHALLGDALYEQTHYHEALPRYDRAIALYDAFFHYYIQRGLTYHHLGNRRAARTDLDRSMQLLPTATAANALGRFALEAGEREQALSYFSDRRRVRFSRRTRGRHIASTVGSAAEPKCLSAGPRAARSRRLCPGTGSHPTPVAVHNVRVIVQYRDARGVVRQNAHMISQVIRAHDAVVVNTGLGPVHSQEVLRSLRVGVDRTSVLQ